MHCSRSLRQSWHHHHLFFAVALFAAPLLQWAQCQSCGPKVSPRLLREIPCDMSTMSYCTQPGSAYPWGAVRRYIYENQGFMKRMYGENRQGQVIGEEIARMNDKYEMPDIVGTFRSAKSDPLTNNGNTGTNSEKDIDLDGNPTISVLLNESIAENHKDTENATTGANEEEVDSESADLVYTTTTAAAGDGLLVNGFSSPSYFEVPEERDTSATTPVADSENAVPDEKPEKPLKGYNACPITQEVVAPYWANNTRGQTLALLNVYPFEQYIHWEKCSFEGEQMNCREGCRCEQQYRLHRLLAFDPQDGCRGIFSDWFRFPGCCVCICYDNHERINNRKARL